MQVVIDESVYKRNDKRKRIKVLVAVNHILFEQSCYYQKNV